MVDGKAVKAKIEDRLRNDAETQLLANPTELQSSGSGEDIRKALHELQVHQIELEMQNAELIKNRAETEIALAKYAEIYEFSPVCYLSLDLAGTITAVNLSGATMLGVERSRLLGRSIGTFIKNEFCPAFEAFIGKVRKVRVNTVIDGGSYLLTEGRSQVPT